jgi:hypothetical protein
LTKHYSPRELAYAGLFGAAALLLPVLFHLIHLGHVFMPMYLPLVTLAFLVRPLPAALTAALVPLLSAAVTGMPPLYPPVAESMSVELGSIALFLAALTTRWPRANEWILLVCALVVGRAVYIGLLYLVSLLIDLPAAFLAGVSFLTGWPGIVLMLVVVPPVVRITRRNSRMALAPSEETRS